MEPTHTFIQGYQRAFEVIELKIRALERTGNAPADILREVKVLLIDPESLSFTFPYGHPFFGEEQMCHCSQLDQACMVPIEEMQALSLPPPPTDKDDRDGHDR